MPSISVIILAGNESRNIRDCVLSARGADEVLVVDDESVDDTAALALEAGARVVSRRLDNFAAQRNFAMSQAAGDWVFFLDADERCSAGLMDAVRRHTAAYPGRAASVTRRNFAFGHRHRFGPLKPDRVTRLLPAGKIRWEGKVHERPLFEGQALPLAGYLEHHTYSDWDQYLQKQFRYADIWAREKHAAGQTSSPLQAVSRGFLGFLKMFVLNLGFLGGPEGWALCAYHSLYTMTKYLKLADLNRAAKGVAK
jgi:glycosyltransferase involved in cell wall biosynthesis